MKLRAIDVAVNDPDNGLPMGRCGVIEFEIHGDSIRIEHNRCGPPCRAGAVFRYREDGRVRLSRRLFTIQKSAYGPGNWCWDRLFMKRAEAHRLIRYLRDSGYWQLSEAGDHFWKWWERQSVPRV